MAAAGTLTVTETQENNLVKVSLAWTATSGGAVSGQATFNLPIGQLIYMYYTPGTSAPSDSVVQTVADVNSLSVLSDGYGGALGTIADGDVAFVGAPLISDKAGTAGIAPMMVGFYNPYTLVVSAAGTSTSATLDLYIRRLV
jgi:hypothetical protein